MENLRETVQLYGDNCIYPDHYHSGAGQDIDMYLDIIKDIPGPVLDCDCGNLRVALPLARAGRWVTCICEHPRMMDYAEDALDEEEGVVGKRIEMIRADLRDFSIDNEFPVIISPFNSFLRLLNEFDQVLALRNIAEHLQDGGRFIMDVFKPDIERDKKILNRQCTLENEKLQGDRVVKYFYYSYDIPNRRVYLNYYYDIFSEDDYHRIEVPFELRYMPYKDFLPLFQRTGLRVEKVLGDYKMNPLDLDSERLIFVLEKE